MSKTLQDAAMVADDQSSVNQQQEDVELAAQVQQPELKIQRTPQGDMKNATYSFYNEDHTLGNLLRN